jgi:DNA/RNA-binding domain of Phe-tRNA-synthetase-like protein
MAIIEVDTALAGKIALGILQTENLTVTGTSPELEESLASLSQKISETYSQPPEAQALFAPARELYRAIGLDPTRRRPSSEALIRRVIKSTGLYRINRGLYDTAEVQWPVELRLGAEGEGYKGLGKDHVNVSGRWTLADREGPFGNPSSDSFRTCIRETTRACTFVIYAPASYPRERLEEYLRIAGERLATFAGATVVGYEFFPIADPQIGTSEMNRRD